MSKECEVWVETLGLYQHDNGAGLGPQGHDAAKATVLSLGMLLKPLPTQQLITMSPPNLSSLVLTC